MGAPPPGAAAAAARPHDHRLIAAWHAAAVAVLSLYGIRVCPFIAGLSPWVVIATFAVAFGAAFLVKLAVEPRLVGDGDPFSRSLRQALFDLALFAAVGVGVALFNHHVLGFPLESGGKVLVGCLAFGVFAGLDNGLYRERRTPVAEAARTEPPRRILPITDRLFAVFIVVALLTGAVAALVVIKDIDYLIAHLDEQPHAALRMSVFKDIGFVVGTVLLLALRLLWSYGRNLRHLLELQVAGLSEVAQGNLDVFVPVTTRDEFSLIAARTNRMIAALREGRREQAELFAVSQALATELRLDPLLAKIMATARGFVGADRVSLFLHDAATDELWGKVAEGVEGTLRFPAGSGLAGDAFRRRAALRVDDAHADPRFNRAFDERSGYRTRSVLCVPVEDRDGRCLGVIQAINKSGGAFAEDDERRLRAFAAQAAVALVNAQLFADLDRARRYAEAILRSLENGVVTLDEGLRVVRANPAALSLLGVDSSLEGRALADALPPGNDWWPTLCATGGHGYLAGIDIARADGAARQANATRVPLADLDDRPIGALLVLEDVTEEKRVRNTLSRYLPTPVAEQLLADPEIRLGGAAIEATVLFSDIRDFTRYTERLGPRATVAMLNEYFGAMVDAIAAHDGILDKFIGDAVMALFGVPYPAAGDADRALRSAFEMQSRLRALNAVRSARGEPPLATGIGLSSGELVAGNVGSPRRMEYTAIGDTVNLAARLESATKDYGVSILLSGATRAALRDRFPLREIDRLRVKGRDEAVVVHQAMLDDERLDDVALARFADARAAYARCDFAVALAGFEAVLSAAPQDGPSRVFANRCRRFIDAPPPAGWDGTWPPAGSG
jgi:adenylate cyclase